MSGSSRSVPSPAAGGPPPSSSAAEFPWPLARYPGKRVLDVALAGLGVVVFSPVMLIVAAAVKATSPGPVIYRGARAGYGARPFDQFKFRSMRVAQGGTGFTKAGDARVTAVGRAIRFLKLDELPQLFNVLRGEMSIVGPRPEDYRVVQEQYRGEQLRVLSARPGLTSIVEVRAFPDFSYYMPPGVDQDQYYREHLLPQRLRDDLDYVDRMSLGLDMKLIAQTLWCIAVKGWWVILQRKFRGEAKAMAPTDDKQDHE